MVSYSWNIIQINAPSLPRNAQATSPRRPIPVLSPVYNKLVSWSSDHRVKAYTCALQSHSSELIEVREKTNKRRRKRETRREKKKLEIMAATRSFLLPATMVFLVLSAAAAAVGAARPMAGEELSGEATAGESIVKFLRQIYRQRLSGPGHSCQTWNPNGGC